MANSQQPAVNSPVNDRPARIRELRELTAHRILVLDGGMGTMVQSYGLDESGYRGDRFADHAVPLQGNNDLLALSQPDILAAIHRAYLDAGADILETNTFSSTTIAQADYKLEHAVRDLNFESARIAREVAGAGSSRA